MQSKTLIDMVKYAIKQDLHLLDNEDNFSFLIKEPHPDAQCSFIEIKLKNQ